MRTFVTGQQNVNNSYFSLQKYFFSSIQQKLPAMQNNLLYDIGN